MRLYKTIKISVPEQIYIKLDFQNIDCNETSKVCFTYSMISFVNFIKHIK
jgi:hypothetical protein